MLKRLLTEDRQLIVWIIALVGIIALSMLIIFSVASAPSPPDSSADYPVVVMIEDVWVYCQRIDPERRIAYRCVTANGVRVVVDYHLSACDGWGMR